MRVTVIISFIFFFLTQHSNGQSAWRIDKLGISEGLSEGYVYAIHQDRKGFIWIGTHGGLNRYDGYNFRAFQYVPFDSSSLGDNSVFFLKEDPTTGKFWVGGSSCLNEFDPETFVNKRYRYTSKQIEFADGVFINQKEILLACEYDVLLFNTHTKVFSTVPVFDENNQRVSLARVENAATDNAGNFMILSKTGIYFFDPASRTCKRKTTTGPDLSPFYGYQVFNVFNDKAGYYWIATNKKGLIRYQPNTKEIVTLPLPAPLKIESTRFDIVMQDSHGSIWAGSSDGLFKINALTLSYEYFSSDKNKTVFLSHPEINAIEEDKSHFMWVGTVGGGINKMIAQNAGFKNVVIAKENAGNTTGTYIMGLQQVGSDMWFMNIWDQVGKANLETGKVTLLSKPILPASYSWYSEGAIVKAGDTAIVLNGENSYQVTDKSNISVLAHPTPGLFYIHHAANGHTYYMVKTVTEKAFCRNDTVFGNQFFYDATDDQQGNTWIGSSKGLLKLDTKTNEVTEYKHNDKNSNSVSSDFIYALAIDDSSKNIWMAAYNGGLCSYNIASQQFLHYTKDDGLADNIVYSIEKDRHGNLWFSTNAGISNYNMSSKSFRNYGKSDGLLNNEFNRRSSFVNDKGWIFFGGIFGIDYFHPDSIVKNNTTPSLAFTNFRVFNRDPVIYNQNAVPLIGLAHSDRYISIEFAALDYNDQQKIQYAYRFSNTSEWIKLGNQHSLSFSDLATGEHTIYIRSTNVEGSWLDNEIKCVIVIYPPWWQTWWFRIPAAIFVIGLLILGIRFYFKRKLEKQRIILEKQQAIEKERTRIATDMHDDLGAGLSRIKFLSETIGIKKQQQQSIDEDIGKIKEYSHEMIDKMGEIVWALNEKNDSLSDLISYTRSYAVEYLSQTGVSCNVDLPDQLPMDFVSGEFRRNIFLSVKEVLHNVAKHSNANHVKMTIHTGTELVIIIHDDGIGFDPAHTRRYGNGLVNIQKRMKDIEGLMKISNGKGTEVKLSAPLPN